jgi:nitroreductase
MYNLKREGMNRKSLLFVIVVLMSGTTLLRSQTEGNSTIDVIMSGYSAKMFSQEPVSGNDLDLILKCGMKAPSARNLQPWRFTVLKDNVLTSQIISDITPGNVLVIISGLDSGQQGGSVDYDCGLATQNMYIAAQSLGLGAHIYWSPLGNINSKKEAFGVPEGYRAVTVLRIGNVDKSVDAVSAASARKKIEEVVNYK